MNWRDVVKQAYSYDEILDPSGDIYMRRYFLDYTKNLRIHHILRSDYDRYLHDHPWDFTSLILGGEYIEERDDGAFHRYYTGDLIRRSAETLHRLTLPSGPVWTYVVTGPVRREWGFQTSNGWMTWRDYFKQQGRN